MNVCVYGASSNDIDRSYIEETEYLGREIATALEQMGSWAQWQGVYTKKMAP